MEQSLADRSDGEEHADRHQSWGCAFDGWPTTALSIVPLLRGIKARVVHTNGDFSYLLYTSMTNFHI